MSWLQLHASMNKERGTPQTMLVSLAIRQTAQAAQHQLLAAVPPGQGLQPRTKVPFTGFDALMGSYKPKP